MFLTADAHAHVRFRRAIERRALWMAEDAARELPNLPIEDALQLVHLRRASDALISRVPSRCPRPVEGAVDGHDARGEELRDLRRLPAQDFAQDEDGMLPQWIDRRRARVCRWG